MISSKIVLMFGLIANSLPWVAPASEDLPKLGFHARPSNKERYIAPNQRFSIELPRGWLPLAYDKETDTVSFVADAPGRPTLAIRRVVVRPGTLARHIIRRQVDQNIAPLPLVKILQEGDRMIAQQPAAMVVATYAYQGNMEYPRAIEEMAVVFGDTAFLFHLECFSGIAAQLAPSMETFYQSFEPMVPGAVPAPEQGFQPKPVAPLNF